MGKIKRQIYRFLLWLKPLALTLVFLLLGLFLLRFGLPFLGKIINKTIKVPKLAYSLLTADTSSLKSDNNRVNFLILGISGGEHEGSQLTDTMIFTSIDKVAADTVMLSLPRDIWLDSLQAKINTAYYYGEEKQKGGGFILAKDAVWETLGQPIHYVFLIDFEGFKKIVDLLQGIEVKVDRSFDDYKYPLAGRENDECEGDKEYQCRYEHLHIGAGLQQMNGETALKFVRSRNAQGEEGTDIARSQRQQKVILALKDKIFSAKVLLNFKKIAELKQVLADNIKFDTQFSDQQITAFLSLFLRFSKNKKPIRTISLDYGDKENLGFLYNPPVLEYGQWVLIPRAEGFQEVHKYVKDKIEKKY